MMKATELCERMEALRPDSEDELDLIDEDNNLSIRIWKENIEPDGSGTWYYRIIIRGCEGIMCEFLPDTVVANSPFNLFMYITTDERKASMQIIGLLEVSGWKVRGE